MVYGSGLENRRTERFREFESHPVRYPYPDLLICKHLIWYISGERGILSYIGGRIMPTQFTHGRASYYALLENAPVRRIEAGRPIICAIHYAQYALSGTHNMRKTKNA